MDVAKATCSLGIPHSATPLMLQLGTFSAMPFGDPFGLGGMLGFDHESVSSMVGFPTARREDFSVVSGFLRFFLDATGASSFRVASEDIRLPTLDFALSEYFLLGGSHAAEFVEGCLSPVAIEPFPIFGSEMPVIVPTPAGIGEVVKVIFSGRPAFAKPPSLTFADVVATADELDDIADEVTRGQAIGPFEMYARSDIAIIDCADMGTDVLLTGLSVRPNVYETGVGFWYIHEPSDAVFMEQAAC